MSKKYRMADVFDGKQSCITVTRINALNDTRSEAAAHAINTHDAMQDRIAELEQELGLTLIALDNKSTLLDSCEKALSDRDLKIETIKQERDQLKSQNVELLGCLIERDGGDHDMDCKVQIRSCDCGHFDVMQLINKSPAACLSDIQAKAIEEVAGIFHDGEYRNHRVIDILIKEANRIRKPLVTKLRQQSTISEKG